MRRQGSRYAPFTERAVALILSIPRGRVASYGQIAGIAGSPAAARQVARVLHSMSRTLHLPWHRVISSRGTISLPRGEGFETQRALLMSEGVAVTVDGAVDVRHHRWVPRVR